MDDLNNQLSSRYNSKLIILNGKPLEIFENILRSSKKSITSLFCEYASEPWERKTFSVITDLFKQENPDTLVKSFSAVHTILDLNKTIASANFRKPKSMKDMERIFSIKQKEFILFYINSKLFLAFVENITPNDIDQELKRTLLKQREQFFKQSLRQNFINNYLNFIYMLE